MKPSNVGSGNRSVSGISTPVCAVSCYPDVITVDMGITKYEVSTVDTTRYEFVIPYGNETPLI